MEFGIRVPESGQGWAVGFAFLALTSSARGVGGGPFLVGLHVLRMLAPVVAVLAGLALLAYLLVQAVRWCAEGGCEAVWAQVTSKVKWRVKAGEVAEVLVEAIAHSTAEDVCDGSVTTHRGQQVPLFGSRPEWCEDDETVCLYRAVGLNEAADIERTGGFRTDPSGRNYEDGKWFASTCEDAITWGSKLIKDGFFVVESCCPKSFVDTLRYEPRWDAIGPAYYITVDKLPIMNLLCRTRFKDGMFGT